MKASFKDGMEYGLVVELEPQSDEERLLLRYFFDDALAKGIRVSGCELGGDSPGYRKAQIICKDKTR